MLSSNLVSVGRNQNHMRGIRFRFFATVILCGSLLLLSLPK